MYFSVRSSEASRISSQVRSIRGDQISVRYLPDDRLAYSVVVPKRQGNAVKRTRVKRIIREIMRLHANTLQHGLYLIYVNRPCTQIDTDTIDAELMTLIDRANRRQADLNNASKPRYNQ